MYSELSSEMAVLGSVLIENKAIVSAATVVDADDFLNRSNRIIWETMSQMHSKQIAIDTLTLLSSLESSGNIEKIGGRQKIVELLEIVPSAANVIHYAEAVKETSIRHKLGRVGARISELASEGDASDAVEKAQRELGKVARRAAPSTVISIGQAMQEAYVHIQAIQDAGSRITGVSTGFRELDDLLAGFHPRELVILAGRPAMGKTALATSFAVKAARQNEGVLMFSLEMDARQLAMRVLSTEARVSLQNMRTAGCEINDWPAMARTTNDCTDLPFAVVDESDLTLSQLRTIAREQAAVKPVRLIVVDYLQLVTVPGAERREREVAMISAGLKALAKELDATVIALSQLNRGLENRVNKRPHLGDLRESGGLEQDADVVMFVYREEYYNKDTPDKGIAELIVAKQRQGPIGTAKVGFRDSRTQFSDIRSFSPGRAG